MFRCPDCESPIQTLDLPCAVCIANSEAAEELKHSYAKSFETRTAYRYRPDEFVTKINRWLFDEETLGTLSMQMHVNAQAQVRGVTFSWGASSRRQPLGFQFDRVRLVKGSLVARDHQDLGKTFNAWSDAHPAPRRLNHWVVTLNGRPIETWILHATPRQWNSAETNPALELPPLL